MSASKRRQLTPAMVLARVDEIRDQRHDDEAAHSLEDDLWGEVLREIAAGADNAAELAAAALKSNDIDFARWCA